MPKQGATQQFVQVEDIRQGVVYVKGGGMRKVLMVGGVNFDLKSEEEQNITLNGFQNFLNGLDFPVQFFIHSRKVNIKRYLKKIEGRKSQEPNELLKTQIEEYIEFVRSFVEENPIISKSFFVVVPYNPSSGAEQAKGILSGILGSVGGRKSEKKEPESGGKSVEQLNHRVEEVTAGLEQIGLRVTPLEDDELIELYYNLYNPKLIEREGEEIPHIKATGN